MSAEAFDNLLHWLAPYIQHGSLHSAPVSEAERLVVTIRYLASGISQQALAASSSCPVVVSRLYYWLHCPSRWLEVLLHWSVSASSQKTKLTQNTYRRLHPYPYAYLMLSINEPLDGEPECLMCLCCLSGIWTEVVRWSLSTRRSMASDTSTFSRPSTASASLHRSPSQSRKTPTPTSPPSAVPTPRRESQCW